MMKKYVKASSNKPKFKIDIQKCYDIEIKDEQGNIVTDSLGDEYTEYYYGNNEKEAMIEAKKMLQDAYNDYDIPDDDIEDTDTKITLNGHFHDKDI